MRLEDGIAARAMPEMENLDNVRSFVDAIVDQDRSMHKLVRIAIPKRSAVARKLAQE